jgi:hypothetical protein
MMSLAGVFSEIVLPADESIRPNQSKLCWLLTVCWKFGYTAGWYYWINSVDNSEFEMECYAVSVDSIVCDITDNDTFFSLHRL